MTIRRVLVMPVVVSMACALTIGNQTVAQEPATIPGNEVLQRFVGAWDLKTTLKRAKWNLEGTEYTGKESTIWALKNRAILIRDMSQPDGKKGLYIATYDAKRDAYPFWGFSSKGLMGAQWLLTWNPEANATVGRSLDSPPTWSSGGQNRFPDANTNLISFWMRNENGELLMDGTGRKDRLPADREGAIVAAWKKHEPADDLPAELNVLDRMIGTWDAVSIQQPAEWTPAGGRSTMKIKREWILNGRFVMDMPIHSTGQEGLTIFGFDPNHNVYRAWRFNSEGEFPRSLSKGSWSESRQTLSYVTELEDGKTLNSSVHFASQNREDWKIKVTDADGRVFFDMETVATRSAGSTD